MKYATFTVSVLPQPASFDELATAKEAQLVVLISRKSTQTHFASIIITINAVTVQSRGLVWPSGKVAQLLSRPTQV